MENCFLSSLCTLHFALFTLHFDRAALAFVSLGDYCPLVERAFIQHAIDSPDDAPRLIFADWLEDHGDADRAEFIRTQCRLARMSEDDPGARELRLWGWGLTEDIETRIAARFGVGSASLSFQGHRPLPRRRGL